MTIIIMTNDNDDVEDEQDDKDAYGNDIENSDEKITVSVFSPVLIERFIYFICFYLCIFMFRMSHLYFINKAPLNSDQLCFLLLY